MARDERDESLETLAEAVADGDAIDWPEARQRVGGAEARLGSLKLLDEVGRVFRDAGRGADSRQALFEWGPLVVLEKLAEGSFGEVYRAFEPQLGREVALKLCKKAPAGSGDPSWLDEAKRLARVRHPNVVTVHGAAEHDGRQGLWTDLIEGETLRERLEHAGTLGADELVATGTTLCQALAAIHGQGLVHGDVKASNVVRETGGRLVLLDFGSGTEPNSPMGAAQGSPLTTAPEVLGGALPTPASDLYSLGAMLYLLATGAPPIQAETWNELRDRVSAGDITPLRDRRPDLPAAVVDVIERALAPDVERRYRSAGELETALRSALGHDPDNEQTTPRTSSRLAVALLLGIVVVVSVWWLVTERSPRAGALRVNADLLLVGPPDAVLRDGDRVSPGDRLELEVDLDREAHFYLLNEDDEGALFVLFPLPSADRGNPLQAGRHRLPGTVGGRPQSWVVTSAGGVERFLMVASSDALPMVENLAALGEHARPDREPQIGRATPQGEQLRGVGGLADGTEASASRLIALRDRLRESDSQDVWTELLRLGNPD